MKLQKCHLRTPVAGQPVLRMVELFEEVTEYERSWKLPFNAVALCAVQDPEDPSWIDLTEQKRRCCYEEGMVYFLTCDTPMRIRYTRSNLHYCIHFRYELFPSIDLFSGVHEFYSLKDDLLADRIRAVFAENDPRLRIAMAESVALDTALRFWPEQLPQNLDEMAQFCKLMPYIDAHLSSRLGIADMAAVMGWSEAYFCRKFHKVFHITPKQYLLRELFARALGALNDPRKSIRQIAEELKFSSEFNFSRFIRHCSGCAPSELRKDGGKR